MNPHPASVKLIGSVLAAVVSLCLTGGIALLFDAKGLRNAELAQQAKAAATKAASAARSNAAALQEM
jgi:hypothetical protein